MQVNSLSLINPPVLSFIEPYSDKYIIQPGLFNNNKNIISAFHWLSEIKHYFKVTFNEDTKKLCIEKNEEYNDTLIQNFINTQLTSLNKLWSDDFLTNIVDSNQPELFCAWVEIKLDNSQIKLLRIYPEKNNDGVLVYKVNGVVNITF